MKAREEKEKQLKDMIFDLSKNHLDFSQYESLQKYYGILEDIYDYEDVNDKFRHYYSEIFSWLSLIDKLPDETEGDLNILAENVRGLKEHYKAVNYKGDRLINIYSQLEKLYDHINLEISRIHYLEALQSDSESNLDQIRCSLNELNKTANEEFSKVNKMSRKVNNAYSEFVSILGIFSAIVLVFFGGTSLLGNAIEVLTKVSIYKSIISCTIVGLLIADIIFIFFALLAKILDRDISSRSPYWGEDSLLEKGRKRYPFIFYFNVLCIMIVSACLGIWKIPGIIRNYFYPQIIKLLKMNGGFEGDEKELSCLIISFFLVNAIFVFLYILSKITNINIGSYIKVSQNSFFYIFADEEKKEYIVYKTVGLTDKKVGVYSTETKATSSLIIHQFLSRIFCWGVNIFRKIVLRYKYMFVINIFLIICIIYFMSK